jgi:NAD(P)H-dependent FMN reductase
MNEQPLNIGIILGSTREGRVSPQVGAWVKNVADERKDAKYEIIDIKEFRLPLLGESNDYSNAAAWQKKLSSLDGFIFVVAEYNHSITGALKNALDSARDEWNNKAAGIVSYGSIGGARAAEHLRTILGELQVADVRSQVLLSLFTDFENGNFKPQSLHLANLNTLFEQVNKWSRALKSIR